MTYLVTGANGFVGAAIVRALSTGGRDVRALVRRSSDCRNLDGLHRVERAYGDLLDQESLRAAVEDCRFVIHAAADYRLWTPDPASMQRTNVQGSLNVLEAAVESGVARIVYTSSVATLGTHADRTPADEESPVSIDDMIGAYKRSKFLAEAAVRDRAAALGAELVIVNPSTPMGPGDFKPTPTGRIIVDAALGRIPAFVDTGLNVVHVDDVAAGHLLALERGRPGERYILGGQNLSLQEILALVAAQAGRAAPSLRLPRWSVYPVAYASELVARWTGKEPRASLDGLRMAAKHMYFSSAKAERELGYRARPAALAVEDAVRWFRQHEYI
jgi:dihydroflavonol-4-reductase